MSDIKRVGYNPCLHTRITDYHEWLAGWEYRIPVHITEGASGTVTDYQFKIDIPFDAAMNKAFNDVRFTTLDGTTLIDSWLESKIDSTSAVVWAEIPSSLEDCYLYFGNKSVANYWDGDATFLQYHGAATSDFIHPLIINSLNNYAVETSARVTTALSNIEVGLGNDIVWTGDKAFIQSYDSGGANVKYLQTLNNSVATQVSEAPCFTTNQWYKGLLTFDGVTAHGYWDNNEIGSGSTTNLPNEMVGLFLNVETDKAEINWAFVRKYVTGPPTYSFGVKERY